MIKGDHKKKTILGLKWSVFNQIISLSSNFLIAIILARLLSPDEFGLVAMVVVVTGFADVFNNFGIGNALIQKKQISDTDTSSVFWLNVIISLIVSVGVASISPMVGVFYANPLLEKMTLVLSANFFISGLSIVQQSLVQRRMDFKLQTIISISSLAVSGIVGILAALNGFGVWALVLRSIVQNLISTVLYWVMNRWVPRLVISRASLQDLLNFSLPLLGQQSLNYWTRNIDNLLIGKFIGAEPLGYYNRSYSLMLLPVRQISAVISRVMFPSFSLIQDEPERIKLIFLKITRVIAFVTFPLMLGLSVTAEPFVLTILGPKWEGMIGVLQILAIVGATQSIGTLTGNVFLARGATRLLFKIGLTVNVFIIAAIVFGLQFGIEAVAICYAAASLLMMLPVYYLMGRLINLSLVEIFRNLWPSFFLSGIMMGFVYLTDQGLIWLGISVYVRFYIDIVCGCGFYILCNAITKPLVFDEIISMVRGINR